MLGVLLLRASRILSGTPGIAQETDFFIEEPALRRPTSVNSKRDFIKAYGSGKGGEWLAGHFPEMPISEREHRLSRYGLNPCGK